MQSKSNPEEMAPAEADPHDIFVIEPQVLREDHVGLAARVEPPFTETFSQDAPAANTAPKLPSRVEDIMGDILGRPSTPNLRVVPEISVAPPLTPARPPVAGKAAAQPVATNFRATAATADAIANDIKIPGDIYPDVKPPRGAWAKRAAFGFLFALASVAAAEAWDRYGDTARQMVADWTPTLPSSQPAATPSAASAQPATPAVEAGVTDPTPTSPAPAALQSAPVTTTATPAAAPDQTTGDIAAMGRQIEALKAEIAQLKAGQEQMAQQLQRDVIKNTVARNAEPKASEARPERPRALGTPPRPLAPPMRRPPHDAYAPPPNAAAMNVSPPYPSRSPTAAPGSMPPPIDGEAPDGGPVVRPPMPLH